MCVIIVAFKTAEGGEGVLGRAAPQVCSQCLTSYQGIEVNICKLSTRNGLVADGASQSSKECKKTKKTILKNTEVQLPEFMAVTRGIAGL